MTSRVHGYELVRPVGAGGFAEVWEARAPDGRRVALKRLHEHLMKDETAAERFRREGAALSRVRHPRIVSLLEALDFPPCLVLEWVDGDTLAELLAREGTLAHARATELLHGVLAALDVVHAEGLVHRDLKPGNVLLAEDGPKLADFGIATELMRSAPDLTPAGTTMATPAYASPELLMGRPHGVGDDLWAAAVLYYECLAGVQPFVGRTLEELVERIVRGEVPKLASRRGDLPEGIDALFATLLSRDATRRPADADAMREAIDVVR